MADNPQVSIEVQDDSLPTLATSALQATAIANQTNGNQQSKIKGNSDGTLIGNVGDSLKVIQSQANIQTFSAFVTAAQIAANKSMISIVNDLTSTVKIKLREIWITNAQTAGVTGIIANFQLNRMTGHSAGTLVVPTAHDSADSLNVGVTVRTGATISGTETTLKRWQFSTDEYGTGPQDVESMDHIMQSISPLYRDQGLWKPITLNANQGIHIKQTVSSTVGTFDLQFIFTQETA